MLSKKSTYISILLFFVGIIFIILSSSFSLAYPNYPKKEEIKDSSEKIIKARDENIINIKLSFIGDSLIGSFKGEIILVILEIC